MEKGPEGEINQAKGTLRQNAQLFLKPFPTLKYHNVQSIKYNNCFAVSSNFAVNIFAYCFIFK
jgi:hypothetical protein